MEKLKCPKYQQEVKINISDAIDEVGEIFMCPNCKNKFRYAPNG